MVPHARSKHRDVTHGGGGGDGGGIRVVLMCCRMVIVRCFQGDSPLIDGAASIIDSTKWTRSEASLFDVSHMCSIRWSGKDAEVSLRHEFPFFFPV